MPNATERKDVRGIYKWQCFEISKNDDTRMANNTAGRTNRTEIPWTTAGGVCHFGTPWDFTGIYVYTAKNYLQVHP